MRNIILAIIFALGTCGGLTQGAMADERPAVRYAKKVRHVCTGLKCGPYAPCGVRCRIVCTDRYSCAPLYGAYGPYGGTGYWGAYTLSGWGYR